jgi:predicted MFS family arabinose efflux permease
LEHESGKQTIKPAANQTLLMVLSAILLVFSGIALHLHTASRELLSVIENQTEILQILLTVLSVIFVYSVYTLLADILESRSNLNGS